MSISERTRSRTKTPWRLFPCLRCSRVRYGKGVVCEIYECNHEGEFGTPPFRNNAFPEREAELRRVFANWVDPTEMVAVFTTDWGENREPIYDGLEGSYGLMRCARCGTDDINETDGCCTIYGVTMELCIKCNRTISYWKKKNPKPF
jgi:hypothetical protein